MENNSISKIYSSFWIFIQKSLFQEEVAHLIPQPQSNGWLKYVKIV